MSKIKPFAVASLFLTLSVAAYGVARYADATAWRLSKEGYSSGRASRAGLGQPDWQTPPPPEQQKEIDDFPPSPFTTDANGRSVPIDPDKRRKLELSDWYAEVYGFASRAVWMIPLAGLFLIVVLHVISRTVHFVMER